MARLAKEIRSTDASQLVASIPKLALMLLYSTSTRPFTTSLMRSRGCQALSDLCDILTEKERS